MSHEGKEFAGKACMCVSAVHVGVDIARAFLPECPSLDVFRMIEPEMLLAATAALAFHLAFERALFDWFVAAAHGSNLTFGWFSAVTEWLGGDLLHQLAWLPTVAGAALALAAIFTFIEIFGLRHRRRQMLFTRVVISVALCCALSRDKTESAIPPREHPTRSQLLFDRV